MSIQKHSTPDSITLSQRVSIKRRGKRMVFTRILLHWDRKMIAELLGTLNEND